MSPEIDHVRHRPSMYIGSTDQNGLHYLFRELLEGSLAEWSVGWCTHIGVEVLADGGCCVYDDGAGIPVSTVANHNYRVAEALLAGVPCDELKVGPHANSSAHGFCLVVLNALSARLLIRISRDGKVWEQEYHRGIPSAPMQAMSETSETGTCITFWLDREIFEQDCAIDHDWLSDRLRTLAYLYPGLAISFRDRRREDHSGERYFSANGAVDFLQRVNRDKTAVSRCIRIQAENIDAEGQRATLDAAIQWMAEASATVRAFAAGHETKAGGTHLQGLYLGLQIAVEAYAAETSNFPDPVPTLDDIRDGGLAGVVSVQIPEPQFVSAMRVYLCNPEIMPWVRDAVASQVLSYLKTHPDEAVAIVQWIHRRRI
jgi:DNA gyrase subunit B